jgi:hypothetical protein
MALFSPPMKTRARIASQLGASDEAQLEIFIDKFDSKNAALIRFARETLCAHARCERTGL